MSLNRRLTSYNVLSSSLASPAYFVHCKPEYLDPEYRFNGLCTKLEKEISEQSIVCLQEVSFQWAGRLHTFFASKNYYFVTALYGNKFSGYMGVGIAVPLNKYKLVNVDITKIADTKSCPQKPSLSFWMQWLIKCVEMVKGIFGIQTPPTYWEYAYNRKNDMVSVGVQCKESNEEFYVGTYHMPCAFVTPQVMTIHSSLAAQHIQKLSQGKAYAFLGDFNIKPDSPMYRLLTEGRMDPSCEAMPANDDGDSWTVDVEPMRSAYMISTGREPNFTNFAQTKHHDEPFVDTLDYIFLSKHWKVNRVESLSHRDFADGPFPAKTEFSDHVLIAAEVELLS